MKKTICILLTLLMALSLFACAAKTEPAAEAVEATEAPAAEVLYSERPAYTCLGAIASPARAL